MVKALVDDQLVEPEQIHSEISFEDGYEGMITGSVRLTDLGRGDPIDVILGGLRRELRCHLRADVNG